jgi:hypothetical protein
VLNWALEGLMRLRRRGGLDPVMPAAMKAMLHDAKVETNSVQAWFEDADIAFSSNTDTVKDHAYHQYAEWCQRNGLSPMASIRFWTRVRNLGDFDESRIRHGARQVRCCNLKLAATTLDKAALTGGYKTPTPLLGQLLCRVTTCRAGLAKTTRHAESQIGAGFSVPCRVVLGWF